VYLRYFDEVGPVLRLRQGRAAWGGFAAAAFGENALLLPLAAATKFAFRLTFYKWYFLPEDEGPADALFLAVRAARGAVAADPADINSYLLMGQSYLYLNHRTRERQWDANFRLLGLVRHLQAVTALEQALKLGPSRQAAE